MSIRRNPFQTQWPSAARASELEDSTGAEFSKLLLRWSHGEIERRYEAGEVSSEPAESQARIGYMLRVVALAAFTIGPGVAYLHVRDDQPDVVEVVAAAISTETDASTQRLARQMRIFEPGPGEFDRTGLAIDAGAAWRGTGAELDALAGAGLGRDPRIDEAVVLQDESIRIAFVGGVLEGAAARGEKALVESAFVLLARLHFDPELKSPRIIVLDPRIYGAVRNVAGRYRPQSSVAADARAFCEDLIEYASAQESDLPKYYEAVNDQEAEMFWRLVEGSGGSRVEKPRPRGARR